MAETMLIVDIAIKPGRVDDFRDKELEGNALKHFGHLGGIIR